MAKNTIKKVVLTGVFALSGAFILSACDDVVAVPTNYEEAIVTKDGKTYEDDANKLGEIYDAITSNKAEKVVSTLLEKLAEKEFGTYEAIESCFEGTAEEQLQKQKDYIAAHKHEFVKAEEDAKVVEILKADGKEVTAEEIQLERFKAFREDLNERINKVVFDEISSDSYRDTIEKNKFLEEKYARAKRQANYDILGFDENGEPTIAWKELYIDNSFKEENVREYLTDFVVNYKDYIVKGIIPGVYKDKLVEEYIIGNNYSALGRAYGRRLNYVRINYTDDDSLEVFKLVSKFVEEKVAILGVETIDYSSITNWIKGFEGVVIDGGEVKIKALSDDLSGILGEAKVLKYKIEKLGVEEEIPLGEYKIFPAGFKYYEKSKLGSILKNFEKAVAAEKSRFASEDDESQLKDFTDNGSRSLEQGLKQKVTDLALEDYSKEGWFVKNDKDGELSNLPETIKNRIFNIKVSNDFDKTAEEYAKVAEDKRYFTYVGSHRFLTPSGKTDLEYQYMIDDTSSKAIYLVEILEAPSTSKLNIDSKTSYLKTEKGATETNAEFAFKTESVAREIAKILGTKDTYTTSAYTSYLKLYTFVYHDSSVYEHLKNTYPDLFED